MLREQSSRKPSILTPGRSLPALGLFSWSALALMLFANRRQRRTIGLGVVLGVTSNGCGIRYPSTRDMDCASTFLRRLWHQCTKCQEHRTNHVTTAFLRVRNEADSIWYISARRAPGAHDA